MVAFSCANETDLKSIFKQLLNVIFLRLEVMILHKVVRHEEKYFLTFNIPMYSFLFGIIIRRTNHALYLPLYSLNGISLFHTILLIDKLTKPYAAAILLLYLVKQAKL